MTELKTFEALECYNLARQLRKRLAELCKALPVCRQTRGSLSETLDQLNVMRGEKYCSEDDYTAIRAELEHVWKVLNGYIAYLQAIPKPFWPPAGSPRRSRRLLRYRVTTELSLPRREVAGGRLMGFGIASSSLCRRRRS